MSAIRTDARRHGWSFWTPDHQPTDEEILSWAGEFDVVYARFVRTGDPWSPGRLQVLFPPKDPYDARAARRFERAREAGIPGPEFVQALHEVGLRIMLDTDGYPHTTWDPHSPVDTDRRHANGLRGFRPSRRRGWRQRGQDHLSRG